MLPPAGELPSTKLPQPSSPPTPFLEGAACIQRLIDIGVPRAILPLASRWGQPRGAIHTPEPPRDQAKTRLQLRPRACLASCAALSCCSLLPSLEILPTNLCLSLSFQGTDLRYHGNQFTAGGVLPSFMCRCHHSGPLDRGLQTDFQRCLVRPAHTGTCRCVCISVCVYI